MEETVGVGQTKANFDLRKCNTIDIILKEASIVHKSRELVCGLFCTPYNNAGLWRLKKPYISQEFAALAQWWYKDILLF